MPEQAQQFRYGVRLEKADPTVNYREAGEAESACAGCRFFQRYDLGCNLVEGLIQPEFTCDMFRVDPAPEMYVEGDEHELAHLVGKQVKLFIDVQSFAEAPEWIPYLPKPTEFRHPLYGLIKITQERNENFVANFNAGVYQDQIPVDAEHMTKLSGAMGWIKEMRVNEDGSADARVEWTERGTKLLADDRFKYISPEFYEEWTDPATDVTYSDVAIGCAITTRPFFKEDHLRPLVASEKGVFDFQETTEHNDQIVVHFAQLATTEPEVADHGGESAMAQNTTPEEPEVVEAQADTPVGLTEEDARTLTEQNQQLSEANRQLTEANQQLSERIGRLEDEGLNRRFTDIAMGRSGSGDGARWFGDVAAHVQHLKDLTRAFGEDSPQVQHYITTQNEHAAQMAGSAAFSSTGESHEPFTGPTQDEVEKRILAKQREATERGQTLTYEQAMNQVFSDDPRLYNEHRRQTARREV